MIKYNKLFAVLANKGMKKTDLVKEKVISSPTLAKLSKNEYVNIEVIDKICQFLEVSPGEIMEAYKTVTFTDKNGIEHKKEVPTNQKNLDMLSEILNSNMISGVMDMFRQQTNNDPAVDTAELLIKDKLNLRNDPIE